MFFRHLNFNLPYYLNSLSLENDSEENSQHMVLIRVIEHTVGICSSGLLSTDASKKWNLGFR